MTNTKIINAGTLVLAGSDLSNATKVTLPASTKKYTLEVVITNGLVPEGTAALVPELRFATSNVDGVAATIAAQLTLNSQVQRSRILPGRSSVTQFTTKPFVPTGSLLYVWFSSPALPADATVDVWLNTVDEATTGGSSSTTPSVSVGIDQTVTVAPAVTAALYATGNSIGGKLVLANAVRVAGGSSRLENILITDKGNQKASGYILFFNADPAAATLTDKTAVALSTDLTKIIGRVDVSAADYVTVDSKAIADVPYANRLLKSAATTSLWAAWVALSTPTFASTSDIQISFKFSAAS